MRRSVRSLVSSISSIVAEGSALSSQSRVLGIEFTSQTSQNLAGSSTGTEGSGPWTTMRSSRFSTKAGSSDNGQKTKLADLYRSKSKAFANPFIKPRDHELYGDSVVLDASLRPSTGPKDAKEEREMGFLPGVVNGLPFDRSGEATTSAHGHSQPVLLDYKEFNRLYLKLGTRGIKSRPMRLKLHGWEAKGKVVTPRVLVDMVHVSALTGLMENVIFKFAPRGSTLTVDVPVVIKGEDLCPGLKAGGYLDEIYKFARLRVPGDRVPPYVVADVSQLNIGESVRFNTLQLPRGCALDPDSYGNTNKTSLRHAVVKVQKSKA